MNRAEAELMTAKTARRNRRLNGPMLGEAERLCYVQLSDKLDRIKDNEAAQLKLLRSMVDLFVDLVGDRRSRPPSPVRQLHVVREE